MISSEDKVGIYFSSHFLTIWNCAHNAVPCLYDWLIFYLHFSLTEIVILLVYYTIPFGFSMILHFLGITFNF